MSLLLSMYLGDHHKAWIISTLEYGEEEGVNLKELVEMLMSDEDISWQKARGILWENLAGMTGVGILEEEDYDTLDPLIRLSASARKDYDAIVTRQMQEYFKQNPIKAGG